MSVAATPTTFTMLLPEEWQQFELESGNFEEFIRQQRSHLREQKSALAEQGTKLDRTAERKIEMFLRQLRGDAIKQNVQMMASFTTAVADDKNEDVGRLLLASCLVSTVSQVELGSKVPLTVGSIVTALSLESADKSPRSDDPTEGSEAGDSSSNKKKDVFGVSPRVSNLEVPKAVKLSGGHAAKSVQLFTFPRTPDRPEDLSVFAQQFLMPTNELGREAAVLTFSTPTVKYAKPLSKLFDTIADTFKLVSTPEETTD